MSPEEINEADQKLAYLRNQPASRFTVEELEFLLKPFASQDKEGRPAGFGDWEEWNLKKVNEIHAAVTQKAPAVEVLESYVGTDADYY